MRLRAIASLAFPLIVAGCGGSPPALVNADADTGDLSAAGDGSLQDLSAGGDLAAGPCKEDKDCAAPNPFCDLKAGQCAACMSDAHCPEAQVCKGGQCAPGCGSGKSCGDAGTCDQDAGICRSCMADADCQDPGNPRCDVAINKCVPCLPANDNCVKGTFCTKVNDAYQCLMGCNIDDECKNSDGGGNTNACCNHVCVDTNSDKANCAACGMACGFGLACCGAGCVNTATNLKNCGGCGSVCNLANGAGSCIVGKCTLDKCNDGFADCDMDHSNGCEVDTSADPKHCTACGMACNVDHGTPACKGGCTVGMCDPGFDDCDKIPDNGCETDLNASLTDCGACGMACKVANGGPACAMGKCAIANCTDPFFDCNKDPADGCELDGSGDAKNCGMCDNVCPQVDNAASGCAMGMCGVGVCNPPFKDCDQKGANGCETNASNELKNCGDCGNACGAVSNGMPACTNGTCAIGSCNGGFKDCNNMVGDGCEINLGTDLKNCGDCGTICGAVMNGAPGCGSGVCGVGSCTMLFSDCDKNAANGCESDGNSDAKNCAGCGKPCPAVNNGTPGCSAAKCGIGVCTKPFDDCNKNAADGCEVDTNADIKNCGMCGKPCPLPMNGSAICTLGVCGFSNCGGTVKDCNMMSGDGCESDTAKDPKNCGACLKVCGAVINGLPGCAASVCGIGSCTAPFKDCKNGVADGCEINSSKDPLNCNACGVVCPAVANATPGCANGACGIGACTGTFKDCKNGANDGCETDSAKDIANCGACVKVCGAITNGTPGCAAGVCGIGTCTGAFKDCKNGAADGCEVDSSKDILNCGACAKVCAAIPNGTSGCAAGVCGIGACAVPFKDCKNGAVDGCETNSSNNILNCGACAKVCAAIPNGTIGCTNGVCGIGICNGTFKDCKNGAADGCETQSATDVNNCGMCAKACTVTNGVAKCTTGQCDVASCTGSFRDCKKAIPNVDGCESNIMTDAKNCGACGTICALGVCSNGKCLYAPVGPQNSIAVTTVTNSGWTQCYLDKYNVKMTTAPVLAACTKARLLVACRVANNATLATLAWAPRSDVIFDTGMTNTPHNANGTGWYFSSTFSWGFAMQGDALARNQCDTGAANPAQRLCWHTGINFGGWRCGTVTNLNDSTAYDRIVYQAD